MFSCPAQRHVPVPSCWPHVTCRQAHVSKQQLRYAYPVLYMHSSYTWCIQSNMYQTGQPSFYLRNTNTLSPQTTTLGRACVMHLRGNKGTNPGESSATMKTYCPSPPALTSTLFLPATHFTFAVTKKGGMWCNLMKAKKQNPWFQKGKVSKPHRKNYIWEEARAELAPKRTSWSPSRSLQGDITAQAGSAPWHKPWGKPSPEPRRSWGSHSPTPPYG